jgi:hypothetical protein
MRTGADGIERNEPARHFFAGPRNTLAMPERSRFADSQASCGTRRAFIHQTDRKINLKNTIMKHLLTILATLSLALGTSFAGCGKIDTDKGKLKAVNAEAKTIDGRHPETRWERRRRHQLPQQSGNREGGLSLTSSDTQAQTRSPGATPDFFLCPVTCGPPSPAHIRIPGTQCRFPCPKPCLQFVTIRKQP